MSSTDRSHGAISGHSDDLLIRGRFSYDADQGALAWSATSASEMAPGDLIDLDRPPVRQAIDLSLRDGTPFSVGHSVVDGAGIVHDLVLCGLPDTEEGRAMVRGVVLELPADGGGDAPEELTRLTRDVRRLPNGVSVDDLSWAGPDALPPELRAMVNLCLESSATSTLIWGEQRRVVYNQAFADLFPELHPQLFGASAPSVTDPAWKYAAEAAERVFATGEAMSVTDQLVAVTGRQQEQDRYFTFALTPIRQADGTVLALFSLGTETTPDVKRRRRLTTLHDLAASGVADGSVPELFSRIASTLAANPTDLPFALMYLVEPDGRTATLQISTGLEGPSNAAAPEMVPLDTVLGWPVAAAIEHGGTLMVDDVQERFPGTGTSSGEVPTRALLAFTDHGHNRLPSLLTVLGVSTRQALDVEYQQFLHRVVRHVQADLAAVAGAQLDRERSANLQRAMQSNRQIGAAIGILMTIHKITEEQAFQLLSKASQQSNRKLRDIADEVVLSGALPPDTLPPGTGRQSSGRRGRDFRNNR